MTRRVALVTGGTRGIGFAIARALAREGMDLALCGVREEPSVAPAIEELRRLGGRVEYVRADVGAAQDRARLIAAVRERYPAITTLVNNAGVAPAVRADLLDVTAESFERLSRVNVEGPFFLTQHVARLMLACKRADPAFPASIVFVTSVSASMASTHRGEYCISKAGLAMTARLFAVRLAEAGIPVYDVRPGIIRTDMTEPVASRYDASIAAGLVPERRWGQPDDVGRVVAALVRGDLPYMTGATIPVDGGLALPRL